MDQIILHIFKKFTSSSIYLGVKHFLFFLKASQICFFDKLDGIGMKVRIKHLKGDSDKLGFKESTSLYRIFIVNI